MKQMLHDYLSVWRHRDLRLMIPARAISAFGDDMALLVLTLRVYSDGRGPWSITILLLCATVPIVVLAPLAGRLVDTVPFRTLASAAAAWQAACCVGLAFADPALAVYALVVVLQLGQVVANPSWVALVPEIAEPDEVGHAMGASQSLSTLAAVAAPAFAGVLAGAFGYGAPLLIDAATFAGLAAAALAIRATRQRSTAESAGTAAPPPAAYSLRRDTLLWPLVLGICALVLVGESTNVVEVFILRGTLGAGTVVFGLVAAVLAVGVVVGSVFAGRNVSDSVRAVRTAVAALGSASLSASPGWRHVGVFAAAWAVVGICNGVANVDASTLMLEPDAGLSAAAGCWRREREVRGSSLAAMLLGGFGGTCSVRDNVRRRRWPDGAVAVALLVRLTRTLSVDSARSAAAPSGPPSEAGRPA